MTVERDLKYNKEIIIREIDGKKEVLYNDDGKLYSVRAIGSKNPYDSWDINNSRLFELYDEIDETNEYYWLCLKGPKNEHEHVTLRSILSIMEDEDREAEEEKDSIFRQVEDSSWKEEDNYSEPNYL